MRAHDKSIVVTGPGGGIGVGEGVAEPLPAEGAPDLAGDEAAFHSGACIEVHGTACA